MSISADPKTIRALAFDLDGTLLAPGSVLTERAVNAIKKCMRRGIKIIIATGRAIEAAEPFRAALGAEGPMICFNGAIVVDMPAGAFLSATLLDKKAAEFCVDLSRERGIYYQVYIPGGLNKDGSADKKIRLIADRDAPEREMYHNHTGILAELGDLKEVLRRPGLEGFVKTMFLADPEILDSLRPRLDEHFGESVYIARSTAAFLEVLNSEVSKGRGLEIAMERLSLKREEVIAFGDEENDLPMFGAAGFSVAPSNAKENVKALADLVTGSNAEDGAAAFLEEYFCL